MKLVELVNVNKKIGKKDILKNISFTLNEGEVIGFIGPNGAGKTTTIKLILGLQKITSGTIKINGYDVERDFKKAIARVGAIVESPDLYMYLSGYENLKLIKNLYPDVDSKRIDEVVKLVGLENRIHDKIKKYSLGMRQRLGIAAALINKPQILILDEPTNGLDPEGIKDIRDLVKKLAQEEHMGIIISSHNLAELESMITNVVVIQNGEVIASDTVDKISKPTETVYQIELNTVENLKLDDYEYKVKDNIIMVSIKKEDVPKLLKRLMDDDFLVYSATESKMSLEESFFNLTGGNEIV